MKRVFKKNSMIITTLAIMIAVAGYLNYSGKMFGEIGRAKETSAKVADQELLDISDDSTDGTVDGTPGEAVLTNGSVEGAVAKAKMMREQTRAKNKETLMGIIDKKELSDEQKKDAIQQMVAMTELSEKEVAAETMLASKGFSEAVVSLTQDSADVVVRSKELTDANRAQIEDIITRKTGIKPEKIVITPICEKKE